MKEDIREYARIGFVHHMLYPRHAVDLAHHAETLVAFSQREDMETFDCCLPFGDENRAAAIPALRACGKEIVYATHLFPYKTMTVATPDPIQQGLARTIMQDCIDCGAAIGATGMIFATGWRPEGVDEAAAREATADFCRWFCERLAPHGIDALLEPFDFDFDKAFLYGPTAECVELIESLQPEHPNFGIELDFAHVPLMHETFEQAARTCAPHLKRVHLGNSVSRDPKHPLYGDKHPPMGLEGGNIDVPEIAQILRLLLDIGFLNKDNRGAVLVEMTPFPGKTAEETIADNLQRLEAGWARV